MDVELSLSWKLGRERAIGTDPVLFVLLAAIRDHGSVSRAAPLARISYRSAWNLLRLWSERLGQPLVHMQRGRGTRLTRLGEKLLWAEAHARASLAPTLETLTRELRTVLDTEVTRTTRGLLVVFASHSLAHELLLELILEQAGIELDLHHHGSLESLRLFNEKRCDLAGFHIVNGALRTELAGRYRALLNSDEHSLISVATRRQGLMVPPGNPKRIVDLGDLTRRGVRFVNRQADSGTRLLFDALLRRGGIDPGAVTGYATEEFTHSAVAALLASHSVDAAFGIEAAAARFGLDFIPFATESYFFAARSSDLDMPAVKALISVLASEGFRGPVRDMPGYEPSRSGRVSEAIV